MSKTLQRLILDGVLLVLIFLIAMPYGTGLVVHEWLSVIFVPFIIAHIIYDWKWVVSVTRRMFRPMARDMRINHTLNLLLFVFMTTALFSGFAISQEALPLLGIGVVPYEFWSGLHSTSAELVLLMIGVHLAMHMKWIVKATKRYVLKNFSRTASTMPAIGD